jgi:hypothetical protein
LSSHRFSQPNPRMSGCQCSGQGVRQGQMCIRWRSSSCSCSRMRSFRRSADNVVERVDGDLEVTCGGRLTIWELGFECGHDCESPERLVIVSGLSITVRHDKVVFVSVVGSQSLLECLHVRVIPRELTVLDHAAPCCTCRVLDGFFARFHNRKSFALRYAVPRSWNYYGFLPPSHQ